MSELISLPLLATSKLISIGLIFQSIELLQLRRSYSDEGIWRWAILNEEFRGLSFLFRYRTFVLLLTTRLLLALIAFCLPVFVVFALLLLLSLMVNVRFRGTFNGGSDYMTIVVLGALTVASAFPDDAAFSLGALYYIVIQVCCSYFVAGVSKLRSGAWLSGRAIPAFLNSGAFGVAPRLSVVMSSPIAAGLAWGTILFECGFPLALLSPTLCAVFLTLGFLFHLANAYLLGLNRFFFVWCATYPCIAWVAIQP